MNKLHPATMVVAFLPKLYDAFRQVLPFLAISFFSGKGDSSELFIAAIGVLGGFGAIGAYLTTRYGVDEGNLVCTSGWLFKRDRRIPLGQIQNVNVKQGLLERFLKVATLEIETAAGSGAEMKLQVITEAAADALRSELTANLIRTATVVEAKDDVVYRLSKSDLLLGAATENQGGFIIFGLLGTLGAAALVQVGYRILQLKEFIPTWLAWGIGISLALGIWILGWIYGGLQYWLRYGGFTVKREPGLFRIAHGLLTKLQFAVRVNRVEIANVTSSVWQRWVGRCSVHVGTAGSFGEAGAMAPIALMVPADTALDSLRSVLPDFEPSQFEWKTYPRYYLWMTFVRSLIGLAVYGGIGAFVATTMVRTGAFRELPILGTALVAVFAVIFVFSMAMAVVGFRKMSYAISSEYVAVRSGVFRKTTSYMPISRIETIGTVEPSWWRRRNVTKATANAMVHVIQLAMLPSQEADDLRRRIFFRPKKPAGYTLDLSPATES